jgi:hypothetical protein
MDRRSFLTMLKSSNCSGLGVVMPSSFRPAILHDCDGCAPRDRVQFTGLRCGPWPSGACATVKDQGEEADQGLGADAVWQAVMDRSNLDVRFQHTEAALDVSERLLAGDGLGGCDICRIGQLRNFAIEEFRSGNGTLIHRPGEAVCGVIGFDEPG